MPRIFQWVILCFCFPILAMGQYPDIGVGEWRAHLSYNSKKFIAKAEDRIYCGTKSGVLYFNKADESVHTLTPIDGLSGISVRALRYHEPSQSLFIAYKNGLIDIIEDQNDIQTLNQINEGNFIGRNVVNDFYFFNGNAYLSGSFGVAVYDISKDEFRATFFGPRDPKWATQSFTALNDTFYAVTEEGLLKASINNPNLQDIGNWKNELVSSQGELVSFKDKLYLEGQESLLVYKNRQWDTIPGLNLQNTTKINLSKTNNKLFVCLLQQGVFRIIPGEGVRQMGLRFGERALQILEDSEGKLWYPISGFLMKNDDGKLGFIGNRGPASTKSWSVHYNNSRIFLTAGGYSKDNLEPNFSSDGFSIFDEKNGWKIYNQSSKDTFVKNKITDITDLAVRKDGQRFYATSYNKGLLEFRNGNFYKLYTPENSKLDYIVGTQSLRVSSVMLDNENNLWIGNNGASNALVVKTNNKNWYNFDVGRNIKILSIIQDDNDNLWLRLDNGGIIVYDYNGTISNPDDDQQQRLNKREGLGGLPTRNVLSMAKDKEGAIWVGTGDGVAVFYSPSSAFNPPINAQQIFVEQGSASGNLLSGESVNAIKVDGGNYKWFGTSNGAFYTNPDGDKLLNSFNEDNSQLLDNQINDITINDENGEVFFATSEGLVSYRGEATKGKQQHSDVYSYPNPVKPDHNGPVTVRGLVANADIKIADAQGNVVKDTRAKGGQVIWDRKNARGQEVNSGVYYVYSTNEDGSETMVTKILIVQ